MIYQPAEDSFLMSQILKEKLPELLRKNPDLKFLEIGAGSGIHLETAKNLGIKKENIYSSDIDKKSVSHCRTLRFPSEAIEKIAPQYREGRLSEGNRRCPRGFNCIHSDLFDKIPKQKFDLIIFNPPYLPEDSREPSDSKLATTGGKKGNEIILKFLKQAKNFLEKNGKIFLITSSLSPEINFAKLCYKAKEIGCEKLFFERLCIWEIT
jgi:methylase of polypeptide subunit release factors